MKIFVFVLIICAQINANSIVIQNHGPLVHPMISGVATFFTTAASVFHKNWVHDLLPLVLEKMHEKFSRMFSSHDDPKERRNLPSKASTPISSESESDSESDSDTGPIISEAELVLEGGAEYRGGTRNGKPWGEGIATYPDGSRYIGSWFDGLPHGLGRIYYPPTQLIEYKIGRWEEGMLIEVYQRGLRDGAVDIGEGIFVETGESETGAALGILEYVDGRLYEGELDGEKPSGDGAMRYPNGDVYRGSFYMGERHGEGSLFCADGTVIEGEWIDNQPNNVGNEHTISYPQGDTYEGLLDDRCIPHGWGQWTLSDGTVVHGNWIDGNVDCPAFIEFPDGFRYIGEFNVLLEPHGYGVLFRPQNPPLVGRFENGYLVEPVVPPNSRDPRNRRRSKC